MLTSGQNPVPSHGRKRASNPPSAPPIINSGASTPPEVPDPSEGDPVPSDPLGSVPRHDSDDQGANHGNCDDERTEMMTCRRDEIRRQALEEKQIREEANQREQGGSDERGKDADDDGQRRNRKNLSRRREVAEVIQRLGLRGLGAHGPSVTFALDLT